MSGNVVAFKVSSSRSPKRSAGQPATAKHKLYRAIRNKCLDCCCDDKKEISMCLTDDCALHELRPYQE